MRVTITVDMEHDCPPYLTTYRGAEGGTPRLLELLGETGVRGTFFTTGDVARRYPGVVRAIVEAGHELGCHGDTHKNFARMDRDEAAGEIRDASAVLRTFAPVTSFRAPNLSFPAEYVELLAAEGYRVDSSLGRHKGGSYFVGPHTRAGVWRIPASMAPSLLRTPWPVRNAICAALSDPAVLFFHPWEFIDATDWPIPLDCRIRTGEPALHHLRETIRFFRERGARFHTVGELGEQLAGRSAAATDRLAA
jgi:peptidoglycan/xylan/chitin deacetylase (PgdA/CDA1 family)